MENRVSYKFSSNYYDLFDLIFLLGGKGNPRSGLLEAIGNEPLHILDVCVGTGTSSILLAGQNAGNRVVGIDISGEMLAVAQRKIDRQKLANLQVQNMSAASMQFNDNCFDAVMISFALHEFEKGMREMVFQEIARVLKPGGIFCAVDFAHQDDRINRVFMKLWAAIEPPCFAYFLEIDWRVNLGSYGLIFESRREFSFSNLYVLRKAGR